MAHHLLSPNGVVVDDLFGDHYTQVTAAVYGYLASHPEHLRLFASGFGKAYLVRCRTNSKHEPGGDGVGGERRAPAVSDTAKGTTDLSTGTTVEVMPGKTFRRRDKPRRG